MNLSLFHVVVTSILVLHDGGGAAVSAVPLLPAPLCVGHAQGGPRVVGIGGALAPVGVGHRRVAVVTAVVVVVGRRSLKRII